MNQQGHEKFMEEALKEAKKSLAKNLLPVGAVLVIDGEVVAKSHKDEKHSYHLDHAEALLVRKYFKGKKIRRKEHYVVVYTTLEPCLMCLGTLLHLPVDIIVYAAKDPYGGGCELLGSEQMPIRHKQNTLEVFGGVLENESKSLLREFMERSEQDFYSIKNNSNPFIRYVLQPDS